MVILVILGVFGHSSDFGSILIILKVSNIFWSFKRFQGYFGYSSGFVVFFVILEILWYFGHSSGFENILVI